MKAIGKLEAAKGLTLYDAPMPKCGHNDVLIKIKQTAICGTDLHIYNWDNWAQKTISPPLTIGHEFVGEIIELGEAVKGYHVGQRVSGEGHITCDVCRNCRTGKAHICDKTKGVGIHRNGAFAEYLSIPARNIIALPKNISDDVATILDPLGNAVHTVLSFDSGFSIIGEDVLITGAGPIGCMATLVCKKAGARRVVVTDINPYRLDFAKKMGADFVVNVQEEDLHEATFSRIGLNEGYDYGLEMSGSLVALGDIIKSARPGARISMLGIPSKCDTEIDWGMFIFKALNIKGIYGREMFDTWYKMLAMLDSNIDVSPIITHHFPYQDFQEGFETMASGNSGKIILRWS